MYSFSYDSVHSEDDYPLYILTKQMEMCAPPQCYGSRTNIGVCGCVSVVDRYRETYHAYTSSEEYTGIVHNDKSAQASACSTQSGVSAQYTGQSTHSLNRLLYTQKLIEAHSGVARTKSSLNVS